MCAPASPRRTARVPTPPCTCTSPYTRPSPCTGPRTSPYHRPTSAKRPPLRLAPAALLALLVACGGPQTGDGDQTALDRARFAEHDADTTPDPLAAVPGRPPTAREVRAIRRLSRIAESLRGLTFVREVPFRVQDRDVITQFVQDEMEDDELERARALYVAIGLLPPDLDIHALLVRVLGEQIVGYYDPERSLLVVREDVVSRLASDGRRELGEAEMVIVHELVHALQDQRLGLGARYEEERTIDADNAFAAVVEGDATLAMIGYMIESQNLSLSGLTQRPAVLRQIINDNPTSMAGSEIDGAPAIVRAPLIARYVDGLLFCAQLHGMNGWPDVDEAHRTPPVSTEQILHPDLYLRGERPDALALPPVEIDGFEARPDETLGEMEMGVYFGLALDGQDSDREAAAGWSGDALRVYVRPEGEAAFVWLSAWDDEAEARQAEAAAEAVARVRGDVGRGHAVRRRGRAVLIARGLPRDALATFEAAFDELAASLPPSPPRGR